MWQAEGNNEADGRVRRWHDQRAEGDWMASIRDGEVYCQLQWWSNDETGTTKGDGTGRGQGEER